SSPRPRAARRAPPRPARRAFSRRLPARRPGRGEGRGARPGGAIASRDGTRGGRPPIPIKRAALMQRPHAAPVERGAELVGAGAENLGEADADAARPPERAALGEVEDVVVLDLAAHDDRRVAIGDLEADADLAAERRHRRRLDEHAADRDVARDGADLAVVLARQRHLEYLVEPDTCALVARPRTGHE